MCMLTKRVHTSIPQYYKVYARGLGYNINFPLNHVGKLATTKRKFSKLAKISKHPGCS